MRWRTTIVALLLALAPGLPDGRLLAAEHSAGRAIDLAQPIEINADTLEIRRRENLAIFEGNVDAVQGRIRLRADRIRVHYREQDDGADNQALGVISKLDATGRVFVSSPRETAQGETGLYDVDNQLLTLEGDVVLTRGENVLRGERLVINLASGVTKLDGAVAGAVSGGGRVKGLFVPNRSGTGKN